VGFFYGLNKCMTIDERIHGSAAVTSNVDLVTLYEVYTLIDITHTGTVSPYNKKIKRFIDDSDTVISSKSSWDKSRNKQRNFETLLQLIGLRSTVQIVELPISLYDNVSKFDFGTTYSGSHNVWKFKFGTDREKPWGEDLEILKADLSFVPIITNLDETVNFSKTLIHTDNEYCNLYINIVSA